MINNFSYSKTGEALTESFEGCKLKAYRDIAGVLSIAYGHTQNVVWGQTCTMEEAIAWLEQDTHNAANAVNRFVTVKLNQQEFDALTDFTFNLGIGAFYRSTMLKDLNAGDFKAAADQFERWDHASGQVVAGLLRRRLAEEVEFNSVE